MKPLEGLTVLDFTQAYSGPYCAMNLADYGARVIKVERKGSGDQTRYWGPYDENGNSGYFAVFNRNKEGISLDMRSDEGKEIIKKLMAKADVVVENFKYGALDRLGLGYEVAKSLNPGIIFASLTGFGQSGPLMEKTAYDNLIESMSGYMEVTGFPQDPPLRSAASIGDSYTGLMLAFAISLAYYRKMLTGKGERIDLAMLDTMFSTIEDAVLAYSVDGTIMSRTGNARPHQFAPYDLYSCSDGDITVGLTEEWMWPAFCKALHLEHLIDAPEYKDNAARCRNVEQLTAELEKYFAGVGLAEAVEKLQAANLPAAPAHTPMTAMSHPQLKGRDMIVPVDDKLLGTFDSFGVPVKFSETPGEIYKPSPLLGEDSEKILKELGYSDEEMAALKENGVYEVPA